jgi:hypothetical protein
VVILSGEVNILTLEHKYPLSIGLIADIHAGETRAVMGDSYITLEGQTIYPNEVQKIINKQWSELTKVFQKYKINYLFNVGDSFAGLNPREEGAYRFLTLPDQLELTTQLIMDLLGDRKEDVIVLNWKGTMYHELRAGSGEMHLELTKRLEEEGVHSEFMGDASYIEVEGVERLRRFFVAHESPQALVYPATLMSREIDWLLKSQATGDALACDASIRAHIHRWLHLDHDGIHAVSLPCWLAWTPWKATIKYFFRLQPSIGGALLLIDEKGRLRFWHFTLPREDKLKLAEEVIKVRKISHPDWFSRVHEKRLK